MFAGIVTHYSTTEPVGTHPNEPQKCHSRPDGKRYPIATILGTVNNQVSPFLKGSVILFVLTVRWRNDKLALEAHN